MRTRNGGHPKPAPPKRTPPARKAAAKTPIKAPDSAAGSTTIPKAAQPKRASAARGKQAKINETSPTPNIDSDSKLQSASVEEENATGDAVQVTVDAKVATASKKTPGKAKGRSPAKRGPKKTPKSGEAAKLKVEESPKEDLIETCDTESSKEQDLVANEIVESVDKEQSTQEVEELPIDNVEVSVKDNLSAVENVGEPANEKTAVETFGGSTNDETFVLNVREHEMKEEIDMELEVDHISNTSLNQEEPVLVEVSELIESDKLSSAKEGEEAEEESEDEEMKKADDKEETTLNHSDREENVNEELHRKDAQPEKDIGYDEGMDEYADRVDFEEHGDEEYVEDDLDEPAEETGGLEDEQRELTDLAKERKIKKEHEIFVGGLDRDVAEDDVRKVFEKIGEVVEVKLHKNLSNNTDKGYAFVKFANKEHAKRTLLEMKNPIICGKRCGTAPSEDNGTLFVGNICNTWTKEAIKQKLKDYGIEGVETITLVPDLQHEGLSRGFAFLEFSCHADAMLAYKRLQKPDAIFGHPNRTVKVAFAEPLREPDPEVMAQVKSVFVDGLPPHWDENYVRELFKGYGDIVRVVLAKNMSTAKRKDFGFVDFCTHEAAVTCIDSLNNTELGDGNSKTKVRARLSNPMPKTQAVKGGMCGGFHIGRGDGGGRTFSRAGRGFGRDGHSFNRSNYRGRGFYPGGRGHTGRFGFLDEYDLNNPYAEFHGRQPFGRAGRSGFLRGNHHASGRGAAPASSRFIIDRPWYGARDVDRGNHFPPSRQPNSPGNFGRPFVGSQCDEPYLYNDSPHGMKRPFYMTEHAPDYVECNRLRPRLDYPDPSFRGPPYRDNFGPSSSFYSHEYYGPDYDGGPYSSYYGGDRPFRGGY